MAQTTKKSSKPIFKTSSPFTETKWPSVSHEDQEVITELLCNLLGPLGEHRKAHLQPSKGRKRKRGSQSPLEDTHPLPVPAVGSHVLIGLNSVTRHLEAIAANSAPSTAPIKWNTSDNKDVSPGRDDTREVLESTLRPLSMVILTHPQPALSPSHAHIPTLLHLATRTTSEATLSECTRLITLPSSNDARFANALHIPRIGAIAILDGAPGAKSLEEYVRRHIELTDCSWIDQATAPHWMGLNVKQA